MSDDPAALCMELRARLGAEPDSPDLQVIYEAWAKRPDWRLDTEAVPLLVGVPPDNWAGRLEAAGAGARAAALTRLAAASLDCAPDEARPALDCYQWARRQHMPLAGHLDLLMQFITSALQPPDQPTPDPGPGAAGGPEPLPAGEVEVLGAALRSLARERDACTGGSGVPEAEAIVEFMLATAARTFTDGEPPMDREAMVRLLERWL